MVSLLSLYYRIQTVYSIQISYVDILYISTHFRAAGFRCLFSPCSIVNCQLPDMDPDSQPISYRPIVGSKVKPYNSNSRRSRQSIESRAFPQKQSARLEPATERKQSGWDALTTGLARAALLGAGLGEGLCKQKNLAGCVVTCICSRVQESEQTQSPTGPPPADTFVLYFVFVSCENKKKKSKKKKKSLETTKKKVLAWDSLMQRIQAVQESQELKDAEASAS